MIKVKIGNIFESKAQTIVNTVNCVGIMGKGIALDFKNRYPAMFKDYVARCNRHEVKLGKPYIYSLKPHMQDMFVPEDREGGGPELILNFPTKDHWRSVSNLADIIRGLEYLEKNYKEWGITSIAVPPLGCGHGQLEWRVVGPTLYRYLSKMNIPVVLYAPHGTPKEELEQEFLACLQNGLSKNSPSDQKSKINPAWVALVEIVSRIEQEPYHWAIGRTTFQKIAYFATEAGIPTGLNYIRGSYGPFSSQVKGLVTKLVNNGIMTEEVLGQGRMFAVKPGKTFDDAKCAFQPDIHKWESTIDRIADLFLRMQTKQAEIAATVFFAERMLERTKKETPSEVEILDEVKRWKQRRKPALNDEDIAKSIRDLNVLRWFNAKPSNELPLPEDILQDA